MTSIDLRQYVAGPTGTWFNDAVNFQPNLLRLSSAEDGLTLVGPLRVKVCVLAQNRFTRASGETSSFQTRDVYSYTLQLGPGDVWSYPEPRAKLVAASEKARALSVSSAEAGASGPADLAFVLSQYVRERPLLGANAGAVLLIRPAGNELCGDPCASSSPCREDPCAVQTGCGCGGKCGCGGGCGGSCGCAGGCANNSDLPCDFAVRGQNVAGFFPSACEPCAPGAPVSMPPTKGPALSVPPAAGGTIRTRFYTGMHMTKEDFEADQKNARIKRALSNRALGQGVAWGFSLGLDGDGVCVTPGYGLDCCGNDIVLTSAYRADAAALLADPAAAQIVAKRGPQRLALVLEYFECPQDVRPVHGDPCTLDGARCEPSRIRETVRMRLAPPCDVDDSGPIKDFLAELEKLRSDPAVAPYFARAAAEHGCGDAAVTSATLAALPFHVQLEIVPPGNQSSNRVGPPTAALPVPAAGGSDAQGDTYILGDGESPSAGYRARITVTLQGGFSFTHSGAPMPLDPATKQPAGSAFALDAQRTNATLVVWDVPWEPKPLAIANGADPIPPQYIHRFGGWQITGSSGSYTGSLDIQYTNLRIKQWRATPWGKQAEQSAEPQVPREAVLVIHLDVPPGQSAGEGKRTFPCFGAPCNPGDTQFWKTFPWLHANPQNPDQAADWRVLVLAILYASLAGRMQESSYGTASYKKSANLDMASAAYAAASKLFFAAMPDTDRLSVSEALQKLLQAWCKGLLYPGPVCRCCPHGVVIGCAVVEGGSIVSVDPWGGRRWVVQYPLLSYWGQQFGIMPADAIASRLFGMICCFAGLAAPKFSVSTSDNIRTRALVSAPGIRPTEPTVGRGSSMQLGPGTLVVDEASAAAQRARQLGATRTETLGPMAFVEKVSALIGVAAGAPAGPALVDYAVAGFPELHFVAPAQGASPSAAPVASGAPVTAVAAAARPFGQLVADEVASQLGKSRVPRLLRPVAESLAFSLAASLPLALPASLAAPFGAADIDTAGKALDRDPEQLLASVLKGKDAGALSALLDKAEGQVRSAVTVVVESLALAAADKQVTERADLRDAAGANQFAQLLGDRLKAAKLTVPRAAVAAAVAEAAQR
jgi:hypothetical protein